MKTENSDKIKMLLIDEDENIHYLFRKMMKKENCRVYESRGGKDGMLLGSNLCPDMIFMDISFKDMDGIEMIRNIRKWSDCSILVMSELSGTDSITKALYAGADDYIIKPFNNNEMRARIYSALRRRVNNKTIKPYDFQGLRLDFYSRQVFLNESEVHLSPVEYRIIECLALNAGNVVTYKMLIDKIWGPYNDYDSKILRVNMANIRRKIEEAPASPKYIVTIPRVGYRMSKE